MAERYFPNIFDGANCGFIEKYAGYGKDLSDKEHFFDFSAFLSKEYHKSPSGSRTVIFNFIDNDRARMVIHDSAIQAIQSDYPFIKEITIADVANETSYGQLFSTIYNDQDSIKETLNILDFYGSLDSSDKVSVYSCAEADVDENLADQFLVANDTAATVAHNWFLSYMDSVTYNPGSKIPRLVYFNCLGENTSVQVKELHTSKCVLESFFALKSFLDTASSSDKNTFIKNVEQIKNLAVKRSEYLLYYEIGRNKNNFNQSSSIEEFASEIFPDLITFCERLGVRLSSVEPNGDIGKDCVNLRSFAPYFRGFFEGRGQLYFGHELGSYLALIYACKLVIDSGLESL